MKHALKLYPEQPVVLNFLGFSWADQNRNLTEAHAHDPARAGSAAERRRDRG